MGEKLEVDMKVATTVLTTDEEMAFYAVESIKRLEAASLDSWEKLPDEQRAMLAVIMRDAFIQLMTDIDAWLPGSLVATEANQQIQVVLSFRWAQIHEKVIALRKVAHDHVRSTRDELLDLRDDLREDTDAPTAQ